MQIKQRWLTTDLYFFFFTEHRYRGFDPFLAFQVQQLPFLFLFSIKIIFQDQQKKKGEIIENNNNKTYLAHLINQKEKLYFV